MAQERGSGGGEMSPIQFRELDDEFMQKQAKVWLEALLEERYGGERSLADLLADGDILFRVSKVFKEMIRSSSGGDAAFPRLPFSEISSTNDAKGGRYLPYSRVDSFLKICKRIGLPDVDLFTPPDVVEKKNLRRVCLCIRALSKKARAQALPVPDFDKVTHTVPMPTDKVGGIRDYLQQAAVAGSSPSPSPRTPQPIGKVLSSPSLAGSAFLETPPPANSKPDRMNSNGDSSEVKFEDETASSELPDDELEDKQSVSASPASDPASEVDDGGNDNDPDLELVDEGSGSAARRSRSCSILLNPAKRESFRTKESKLWICTSSCHRCRSAGRRRFSGGSAQKAKEGSRLLCREGRRYSGENLSHLRHRTVDRAGGKESEPGIKPGSYLSH